MPDSRQLFDQDQPDAPVSRRVPAEETEGPAGATRPAAAYPEPVELDDADDFVDGGRYVRIPEPSGPLRRAFYVVATFVIIVALIVAGTAVWIQRQINPPGGPGDAQTVIVPSGSTTDDIVNLLADEGIVSNPTVFRYYLRWRGEGPFQAGEYTLVQNSAFDDVITTLAAGPAAERFERFTVPEGLTLDEIAERLDDQIEGFDADEVPSALIRMESRWRPEDVDSWEGLLFPDTYEYRATEDTLSILQRMNRQFDTVATEVLFDPAINLDPNTLQYTGPSAYEYVIIASMIEKEARLPEEHALMSRVIHNRLALGMTLGIDATVIYARGPERTGPITDADLAIDSPYNTRLNPGLPPTPIATPSRSALEAARNPADGPWLYYVLADADGSHFFTDDYNEFLRVRDESRAAGLF
ncbi:MAG: endolytic transglycosylase MltG [Acidimicrobiales bacterium]